LKRLAAEAEQATDDAVALAAWRRVLELLPRGSRQFEQIAGKVTVLSDRIDAGKKPVKEHKGLWGKIAGGAGAAVLFLLTKGKLLLLGLVNAQTLFSMLLSLGVYWAVWGWKLAAGLILSIYVHEMGHVFMLQRFGIRATAPMFIPGVGAIVQLKQRLATPREDARVGLAGPMWGLGAAIVSYVVYLASGAGLWAATAQVGAWINLFNLTPIWQLDGGRGFRSLSRPQRWIAAAVVAAMFWATKEGLLVLLLVVAVVRAFSPTAPTTTDGKGLAQYVLLVVILAAMTKIPVPTGAVTH
jgi:Zn-dependent protease